MNSKTIKSAAIEPLSSILSILKSAVESGMIDTEAAEQIKEEMLRSKLKEYRKKYKKTARGYYTVHVPDKDAADGRRSLTSSTEKGLDAKLIEYFGNEHDQEMYCLEHVFQDFLSQAKAERAGGTVHRYSVDWNRYFAGTALSKKDIRSIKVSSLRKDLIGICKAHHVNQRQYSDLKTLLNKIFDFAVINDMITTNPSVLIRDLSRNRNVVQPDAVKTDKQQVFSASEVEKMIDAGIKLFLKRKNTAYLGIVLNLMLGLRVGEMVGLRFEDIDTAADPMILTLSRSEREVFTDSGQKHGYTLINTLKAGYSSAKIVFPKEALGLIEVIHRFNLEQFGKADWIFMSTGGERMHANSLESALRRLCDHVGIPRRSFHKLRKTYASTLIENALSATDVQKQLRHKDTTTTLNDYVFSRSDEKGLAVRVESALSDLQMQEAVEALKSGLQTDTETGIQ